MLLQNFVDCVMVMSTKNDGEAFVTFVKSHERRAATLFGDENVAMTLLLLSQAMTFNGANYLCLPTKAKLTFSLSPLTLS